MLQLHYHPGNASMAPRSLPHLAPYLQRRLARPAVQRVFEQERPAQPPV